ncbi:MAG: HAD family hydrolase [Bacillota bacterium]|nr:HAD family hydrolase [Bacillota bacterium]
MLEAVIFDMDGVIIDSEPIHFEVDKCTLKHCDIDILDEELNEYVGMTNPEMWSRLREKYNIILSVEELIKLQMELKLTILDERDVVPIDGVTALLKELKDNNIKIALASSSPREFIMAVLKKFNIEEYFIKILSGEEVTKGKPAPDIFQEVSRMLEVKPEKCIVIEDSRNGVKAAKAADMKCIGFKNINSGNQDLSKADLMVDSLEEVNLAIIKGLFVD